MPGPVAAAAGSAVGDADLDAVAESAFDSDGVNIVLVLAGLAAL